MEKREYSSWMLERIAIGESVRLRLGSSTIGRHSSSVIRLLDSCVSRHHAIIKVSEDDESVSMQIVSINGIYVNGTQHNTSVKLKNNDRLGFGVNSDEFENADSAEIIKMPIYELKYAPIRPLRISNPNRPMALLAVSGVNSGNYDEQKPLCSKTIKVEKLFQKDEVVEISDDEDEKTVIPKTSKGEENPKDTDFSCNNKQQELLNDLAKLNIIVVKDAPNDNRDCISPSKKNFRKSLNEMVLNEDKNSKESFPPTEDANSCLQKNSNDILKAEDLITAEESQHKLNTTKEKLTDDKEKRPALHFPIITSLKKEILRNVSTDIENIFGDIDDDDELQKAIKEINPLVYNELHKTKNLKPLSDDNPLKMLNNGDRIEIIDDEIEKEELGTLFPNTKDSTENKSTAAEEEGTKSPNVFDSSLDNSKGKVSIGEQQKSHGNDNEKILQDVPINDNINLDEYTKNSVNSDDEDMEEFMFSQVLINDMKDELQDDIENNDNISLPDVTNVNNVREILAIKKEPGLEAVSAVPKEMENSCWIISDDEDFDEELETKVNEWSNKICSQSFSLLSQVYDLEEPTSPQDTNEEDKFVGEDNLSLLEDDIEGIANIYNSSNIEVEDRLRTDRETKTNDEQTNKQKEISAEKLRTVKESSPVKETVSHDNLTESPLIRKRCLRKTKPVLQSPSSSDDEFYLKDHKPNEAIKPLEPEKSFAKLPPQVIDASSLPKHKGELRGVSVEILKNISTTTKLKSNTVEKKLSSIKEKITHERITNDLKRKWLEKPSIAKKHDKEHKKFIQECRKNKLKELAERKKSPTKENKKRKLSTEEQPKAKVAKVKVTTHNRGAFLASNDAIPPAAAKSESKNQFKIPKIVKKSEEPTKKPTIALTRTHSIDNFETFSQQISKPDAILFKRHANKCDKTPACSNQSNVAAPMRRHSINETPKRPTQSHTNRRATPPPPSNPICKEAVAARAVRTTNKITFASMEKNIIDSEENKRKLCALSSNNNNCNSSGSASAKKKTVRFNDTPIVHYIERIMGACKKIIDKDVRPMTTYRDRRHLVRTQYPIIDYTDTIISDILCWSNEWLIKRNADADAAGDVIYPMPTCFNSFEQYKSIIFPLMKLEFVRTLERDFHETQELNHFKVSLEYATHNKDRIMLITKFFHNHNKKLTDSSLYDLVILEPDQNGPQMFGHVVGNRKGTGTFTTIVYEIIAKNFTIEYFKGKEFQVRPVMDKVRVHFGAFNSVYQLQSTPLFQKIINPLELLNSRPPPKKKVMYRGFDQLNDIQRQVLLNTYIKIIDETTPNISLIQGPPGTGKSCVITNLALQTLYGEEVRYLDKKILICAQSNAAIDVIAGKLYDVSMRMRPEKRFRLIRYGMLDKMNPNVLPVALQKVVEHDQLKRLQAKNKNIQLENKENLKNQILQFETQIAEMSSRNIKGTVEEDVLIEKKRQLQLMRNILNENTRPEDERSLYSWYLSNANIICATLASCVNLIQYVNFFDICIIDEATQCTEPWTLLPLKYGINSLVLVGDTQQLPATVLSKKANELGLGNSMFTRIQRCLDNIPSSSAKGSQAAVTTPNNIISGLQTQYRMHPEICRWPNQYFYRNELINGKSIMDFTKSPLVPFCILNLNYTQQNFCSNGKITNDLEAEFVAKLLKALDGFIPNKYNSYGVITPYAQHRGTLESSIRSLGLTNIMVNTIDSYQGLEKDVIVISNARTRGVGFLSNPQRLNVALTRSKKCLILCGNFKNLQTVPAWRCLLQSARERKLFHEINENCIADMQTNVIDKLKLKNQSHNNNI